MQSLLIFTAELQTAKRRFLEQFESSDDYRFSQEHSEEAQRHQEHIVRKPWKGHSMYERRETTSHGVLSATLRRNQNRID
jgi:hypothetical protein